MKKAVFITVRSDSTRLPGKALKEILGKPTIEHVILRAKRVRNVDQVVLCTTERPVDDGIAEIAQRCGVSCFRGSMEDKLVRWLGAAEKFGIDVFATFDGDDLLCEPELIEWGIEQMAAEGLDFMKAPKDLICGSFTNCIRVTALKRVCEIKDTEDTEMMWVYFEDTGLFKTGELKVKDSVYLDPSIRLTLDYPEDFEFFKNIMEHFASKDNGTSLREIIKYLSANPEVKKLNYFRQQDYLSNQKKKTKLVLKRGSV